MNEYLYILSFETTELIEVSLTQEQYDYYNEDINKILSDLGYNPKDCSCMWSSFPLSLHRVEFEEIIPHNYKAVRLC